MTVSTTILVDLPALSLSFANLILLIGKQALPEDLDCLHSSRSDIAEFATRCSQLKIQYVGLCCGNAPHYTRKLAETLGRTPEASKYSPDMSKHGWYGTNNNVVNKFYGDLTRKKDWGKNDCKA